MIVELMPTWSLNIFPNDSFESSPQSISVDTKHILCSPYLRKAICHNRCNHICLHTCTSPCGRPTLVKTLILVTTKIHVTDFLHVMLYFFLFIHLSKNDLLLRMTYDHLLRI